MRTVFGDGLEPKTVRMADPTGGQPTALDSPDRPDREVERLEPVLRALLDGEGQVEGERDLLEDLRDHDPQAGADAHAVVGEACSPARPCPCRRRRPAGSGRWRSRGIGIRPRPATPKMPPVLTRHHVRADAAELEAAEAVQVARDRTARRSACRGWWPRRSRGGSGPACPSRRAGCRWSSTCGPRPSPW